MKYKIVADSACNIVSGEDGTFASVPMKIVAEREYVDDVFQFLFFALRPMQKENFIEFHFKRDFCT